MTDMLTAAVAAITERFGAELQEFRGEKTLIIPAGQVEEITRSLRDEFLFDFLVDITVVDYWPAETPRFHVVYQLYSMQHNSLLRLRAPVNNAKASIHTIEKVYPGANWYEREVWDMFGIHIEDHSDLRRIIMPADWVGHPLRKDYPLGYEEVQFSFNYEEINLRKPKPSR
jgi:NADH-quinone oxidoreductase subunit C